MPKKVWTARMKIIDGTMIEKNLSPLFSDINECQEYIDKNLKIMEYLCEQLQQEYDHNQKIFAIRFGNYIRCYNVDQQRFCNGMDF